MAQFTYKAIDNTGKTVSGRIEAVDRKGAVADLAAKGLFASEIITGTIAIEDSVKKTITLKKPKLLSSSKIKGKDIVAMTAQLSTALRAGLPMLNAIEIIGQQQHKEAMKTLVDDMAKEVSGGKSLSDALSQRPDIFSELYISMVRVGETGGILEQTMTQLSDLISRDEKIKTTMKNALIYPAIVLSVGIISVIIMITFVLPKIINTLGEDMVLPLPTLMLLGLSDFLVKFGWLLALAIGLGIYYFSRWKKTPHGRLKLDTLKLKTPILGSVLKCISVGRFARTLGALTTCGITILEALSVVRGTLANELLAKNIDKVASKVKMGQPLAEPLLESGLFPPLLVQIVSIGEQTGKLDELLLNAANTFDDEADAAVTRFLSVFPSMIILLLAVVIFFIIAATLLPIVAMNLGSTGI